MDPEWKSRYELAVEATVRAGQAAHRYFDAAFEVEWKQDESPVTIADREAEQAIRDVVGRAFPKDGFLGEEFGDQPSETGFRWIIDPIDATRNFIRGIPIWGTLVGLEYQGEMIAGVVEMPAMSRSYRALRGDGAYRGERKLHVSNVETLADSTIFYTVQDCLIQADRREAFDELLRQVAIGRGYGDFFGFMLVAQGSGEMMVDYGVHAWDVAAVKPIVEEAGGTFTNWDGGASIDKPDVLVSNGKLHEQGLHFLR